MPRMHPVTGLPLEDGFGALSDDLQAERIHIPYIRQWQGQAAAEAMLAKLHAEEAGQPPSEPPPPVEPEPVVPPAPIDLPPAPDPEPIMVLKPEPAPADPVEEPHAP